MNKMEENLSFGEKESTQNLEEIVLYLDLRKITGKILSTTPECVIFEIAVYSQIVYKSEYLLLKEYVDNINVLLDHCQYPEISLSEIEDPENSFYLASFISYEKDRWSSKNLKTAFTHLYGFCNDENFKLPPHDFTFGPKKNSAPLRYNACMLYALCQYYKIETSLGMKIEDMARSIKILSLGDRNLKNQIIAAISDFSVSRLINLYNSEYISKSLDPLIKKDENNDHKFVTTCHKKEWKLEENLSILMNTSNLICRIIPNNHEEAIIITAFRFGINICEANNPMNQFHLLRSSSFSGKVPIHYIPISDEDFMKKYLRNPSFYDVKHTWSEKLSFIYDEKTLYKFAIAEGFEEERLKMRNCKDLLKESRIHHNIYQGKNPYCSEEITVIYNDSIFEIEESLLLSYGVLETKNIYYISVAELTSWLKKAKNFIDPVYKTPLSFQIINKLKKIASYHTDNDIIGNSYKKLLQVIEETKNIEMSCTEKSRELSMITLEMLPEDHIVIERFFTAVVNLAFYMRGWMVTDKHTQHPCKACYTNYDYKLYQDIVENNVTIAASRVFEIYDALPSTIKELIYHLPLIKFNKSNTPYVLFGETVYKNLVIDYSMKFCDAIVNLKNSHDEKACIRTSSNWILVSGIYYGKIANCNIDISIDAISCIS
jgi:hypothetical protein